MSFLSKSSVLFLRVFQVIMPLLTLGFFTADFPTLGFKLVWCLALFLFECFAWNTVRGELTPEGLKYFRMWGVHTIPWSDIRTVRIWPATNGIILRVKTSNMLGKFKILLNGEKLDQLLHVRERDESEAVTQTRNRLVGRVG